MSDIEQLVAEVRRFAEERDWVQFHDPKSLVLALMGEVGEMAELIQWLPADKAAEVASTPPLQRRVADELADVFTYLLRLSDVLDVDLERAFAEKLERSRRRFPVDAVRGVAPVRE